MQVAEKQVVILKYQLFLSLVI
uniref:Uncharacterized protein n=1 Tax=Anopheles albimanus TaxID=7167 RepID=A0A182FV40_ANOAL